MRATTPLFGLVLIFSGAAADPAVTVPPPAPATAPAQATPAAAAQPALVCKPVVREGILIGKACKTHEAWERDRLETQRKLDDLQIRAFEKSR